MPQSRITDFPMHHKETLRKQAYSSILKILPPKNKRNSDKNSDIIHISALILDCGYSLELSQRGSFNEYQQSIFLGRNKKNNVYPCKHQFYYIKVGFKGSALYRHVFVMWCGASNDKPNATYETTDVQTKKNTLRKHAYLYILKILPPQKFKIAR